MTTENIYSLTILRYDFKVWDKNGKCFGVFNRSLLPLLKLVS